jgi:hypothetical protein
MTGPVVGSVSYKQSGTSALELGITVDFGRPSVSYTVFLTAGPSHSQLTGGFASVGTLGTNAAGSGSASITVPLSVLLGPSFGSGYRNDHLDLVGSPAGGGVSILAVGAINYFVCRSTGVRAEGEGEVQAEEPQAQPQLPASGEGDPLDSLLTATGQDPLTVRQG